MVLVLINLSEGVLTEGLADEGPHGSSSRAVPRRSHETQWRLLVYLVVENIHVVHAWSVHVAEICQPVANFAEKIDFCLGRQSRILFVLNICTKSSAASSSRLVESGHLAETERNSVKVTRTMGGRQPFSKRMGF